MTGPAFPPLRSSSSVLFLDIEASALLCGYLIEIAWVDALGKGESHLIRPADEWLEPRSRFTWSEASQSLHGVTPGMLRSRGRSHRRVAKRTVEVLGRTGAIVVSDNPEMDARWLGALLDAAGIARRIEITIVDAVYMDAVLPLTRLLAPGAESGGPEIRRILEIVNRILLDVEQRFGSEVREHRALPDAMRMWRQWTDIRDEVARSVAEEMER